MLSQNNLAEIKFVKPENEEALAETLALGTAMLRKKRKREIIDGSFNKYTFDD